MSASPHALHVLAHRAAVGRRDESDWWGSPLETALAAVAAARHPPAHREAAERALDSVVLWSEQASRRNVSGDAAAVALAAAAAKSLARSDKELTADAATRVAAVASRDTAVVPELHVALAAWALDDLVKERAADPWPSVRERVRRGSAYGVDAALRAYSAAVAEPVFDAAGLVRELLRTVPPSPPPSEGAQVAWLLSAAVERCAKALPANEPGLLALVDQRAALVDRLAVELGERSFWEPDVPEFDPDAPQPFPHTVNVSSLEALLLDCALASREPEVPWVRMEEAHSLLGDREAVADARGSKWRKTAALAVGACGVLAGAVTALGLVLGRSAVVAAIAFGAAVAAAGLFAAAVLWRPVGARPKVVEAVAAFTATSGLSAVAYGVNAVLPEPVFSDAGGLVGGLVLSSAASLLWAAFVVERRRR